MFEEELAFFRKHQDDLVAKFRGQTLLLRGADVVGVYPTPLAAQMHALSLFPAGSYMIQPCEPGPGAYTVTIGSHEVAG